MDFSHSNFNPCQMKEKTELKNISKNTQKIITTLPKAITGVLVASQKACEIYQYQGFWYYPRFIEGIMLVQEKFKAQPNQIFLGSMPKCGTTWLKALALAIITRNVHADFSAHPLLTASPHQCVSYLETDETMGLFLKAHKDQNQPIPQVLATHMPITSLPESMISTCKIVYICRNPKDAFISMWHFESKFPPEFQKAITFEEAFEQFCSGLCNFGPYWDHILGYWKSSLKWPENILFLKYEELKMDREFYVKKLAEFVEQPFSIEEERDGVVQKIIELCGFDNLRK